MRIIPILSVLTCITLAGTNVKAQNSITIGANNELKFVDNGQIRSLDDNHRIFYSAGQKISWSYGRSEVLYFHPALQADNKLRKCSCSKMALWG